VKPPSLAPGDLIQLAITSKNVAALSAFYRDIVGLRHLFDASPSLTFFDLGGVRLMISPPSSPELDHAASILYFRVIDLEATHDALKSRGALEERAPGLTARMPDHELWTSFFRDPDGNLFALMCEKRPAK